MKTSSANDEIYLGRGISLKVELLEGGTWGWTLHKQAALIDLDADYPTREAAVETGEALGKVLRDDAGGDVDEYFRLTAE